MNGSIATHADSRLPLQAVVERIDYLDAMRAVLMMLGVVLHSALVFDPADHWLIESRYPVGVAALIVDSIHAFRMPAFFVVSGFFCAYTLGRYGWPRFLRLRMTRIVIPLAMTGLTLNSIQEILLVEFADAPFSWGHYLFGGGWVFHLWFLDDLMIYFATAALIAAAAPDAAARAGRLLGGIANAMPMFLLISLMPVAAVTFKVLGNLGVPVYGRIPGVVDVHSLLSFAPYFVVGCLLATDRKLLDRLAGVNPAFSIAVVVLADVLVRTVDVDLGVTEKAIHEYSTALIAWHSVAICFWLFRVLFSRQSALWSFLSDASYTVYLFHHVFVIGFGLVLIAAGVPGYVGLPLLIVLTMSTTLAIHALLIRRFTVLRYLFNGK